MTDIANLKQTLKLALEGHPICFVHIQEAQKYAESLDVYIGTLELTVAALSNQLVAKDIKPDEPIVEKVAAGPSYSSTNSRFVMDIKPEEPVAEKVAERIYASTNSRTKFVMDGDMAEEFDVGHDPWAGPRPFGSPR